MKKILLLLVLIGSNSYAGMTAGSFVKTIATAGTEEALSTSLTGVGELRCKAEADNTGIIYIGGNPVTSATGLEMSEDNAFVFYGSKKSGTTQNDIDPSVIFIDTSVDTDGVECFWIRFN